MPVNTCARYAIGLTPQPNASQAKQPPRVSVVVVSRNRAALLRRCLDSLEQSEARPTLQAIVVDNGSADGSARLDTAFPAVQFVPLPKNFGLTKALNIGWRAADAAYVLFLHDDTEVEPLTVARLADVLDATPEAAAVCPCWLMPKAGPPRNSAVSRPMATGVPPNLPATTRFPSSIRAARPS
jgi:GT2 family glycosyltransferase